MANTANFGELLEPGLRVVYDSARKMWPDEYSRIFEVRNSTKAVEHALSMTGFGVMPVKAQGAGVDYDDPIQGYKHSLTNVTYGLGYIVTLEMFEDDQYDKINALPKALARSGSYTVEITSANILNNGFVTTYTTGGDGLALFSASHLLEGGGTWKNKLSTDADLSMTSLEQALIDIGDFVDGRGNLIPVMPKKLIVPTEGDWTATQILGSDKDPESANNAINPAKNKLTKEVNHYLTDPDAWFILTDQPNGLVFYWRRKPAMTRDNDHDSDNAKFKQTMRFVCGWDDPRGIFGSAGA